MEVAAFLAGVLLVVDFAIADLAVVDFEAVAFLAGGRPPAAVLVNVVAFVVLGPAPARALGVDFATDVFVAVVVRVVLDADFLPPGAPFATPDLDVVFAVPFFAAVDFVREAFVVVARLAVAGMAVAFFVVAFTVAFFVVFFVVAFAVVAFFVVGADVVVAVDFITARDVAVFFVVFFAAIRSSVARAIDPDKWG